MNPPPAIRLLLASLLGMILSPHSGAQVWYVAPVNGEDSHAGTIDFPFLTISKAASVASAGDTIFVRGGTYSYAASTSLTAAGDSLHRYSVLAYQDERPILDYSGAGAGSRGIELSGSYWTIRGLVVEHAPDNGVHITGSENILDRCVTRENGDTGVQLDGGASGNQIINCDSYENVDASQGNADGFAVKLAVGSGNAFKGCRSWSNSDDGWDGYLRGADNVSSTLENCWSFMNGYLKGGTVSLGNGNGFKMGGSDLKDLAHDVTLTRCLAFDNRAKGFDQNNNRGSMILHHCTAYRNGGNNYSLGQIVDSGKTIELVNCASLGFYGSVSPSAGQATNSWLPPFITGDNDFVTTDTSGVRGPRKPDGGLPEVAFLHLNSGSDLIDAGTDLGLPFAGAAPDLGCFEFSVPDALGLRPARTMETSLSQNFPNPFNPTTTIRFSIAKRTSVDLTVVDLLGRRVAVLVDETRPPGEYSVAFDGAHLASGSYLAVLRSGSAVIVRTMMLVK
jgi:hypothetical protein